MLKSTQCFQTVKKTKSFVFCTFDSGMFVWSNGEHQFRQCLDSVILFLLLRLTIALIDTITLLQNISINIITGVVGCTIFSRHFSEFFETAIQLYTRLVLQYTYNIKSPKLFGFASHFSSHPSHPSHPLLSRCGSVSERLLTAILDRFFFARWRWLCCMLQSVVVFSRCFIRATHYFGRVR